MNEFQEFLRIVERLQANQIRPWLLGSLGVQRLLGVDMQPDDIDIQLLHRDLDQFDRLTAIMQGLGYRLTDQHEHEFSNGVTTVNFGDVETLEAYAGVKPTDCQWQAEGFYLPTRTQFAAVYRASVVDDWRQDKPKDRQILGLLLGSGQGNRRD